MIFNFVLDYSFDKKSSEADIREISFGADKAGNVSGSFHLGNLPLESRKMGSLILTFPKVLLHEAQIEYEDNSLVKRFIKAGAKENGVSPEKFKDVIIRGIDREISRVADSGFAKNILYYKGLSLKFRSSSN